MKNVISFPADNEDAHRRELRVWMRQVLLTRHLSAESWAREAGVAGSTLRRFLNGGPESPTPSLSTVEALARVVGFGPNLSFARGFGDARPVAEKTRLVPPDIARRLVTRAAYQDEMPSLARCPTIAVDPGDCSVFAFAVIVEHMSANQLGVLIGDAVIVEPLWALQPAANDLVLVDDLSQVMVMTCLLPYAMPRSTDQTYVPRLLDDVTLLGTVTQLRRRVLNR